jgi:hypothetical protein
MTDDALSAILDQLAVHREQVTQLDAREARHFASLAEQLTQLNAMITAVGQVLRDDTADLARIEALEQAVTDLAAGLPGGTAGQDDPRSGPAWWKMSGPERQEPVARLRSWVKEVYRPGYGHLAVALAPCWPAHDLCLYGLDILSGLWSALYLEPGARSAAVLSAQAEFQARIVPAIAAQLTAETTGCGHEQPRRPPAGYARSQP